jgi:hypothetical protein
VVLQEDLVDPEIISAYLGMSAQRVWFQLGEYMELEHQEREKNGGGPWDCYFAYLIKRIRQSPPESVRRDLMEFD